MRHRLVSLTEACVYNVTHLFSISVMVLLPWQLKLDVQYMFMNVATDGLFSCMIWDVAGSYSVQLLLPGYAYL